VESIADAKAAITRIKSSSIRKLVKSKKSMI